MNHLDIWKTQHQTQPEKRIFIPKNELSRMCSLAKFSGHMVLKLIEKIGDKPYDEQLAYVQEVASWQRPDSAFQQLLSQMVVWRLTQ